MWFVALLAHFEGAVALVDDQIPNAVGFLGN